MMQVATSTFQTEAEDGVPDLSIGRAGLPGTEVGSVYLDHLSVANTMILASTERQRQMSAPS